MAKEMDFSWQKSCTHTEFCLGFKAAGWHSVFVQSYADKTGNVCVFVSKSTIIISLKRKT